MVEYTLPFGKFRGQPPSVADVGYLCWMLKVCKLSSGLRAAIRADLLSREVPEDQLPPEPEAKPLPSCRRCGSEDRRLYWVDLPGTTSQIIRVDCRRCTNYVCYAPQSNENKALADADSAPPIVDTRRERFELQVEAQPGPVPAAVRLRQVAKGLLRQHGFKLTSCRELK